MVITSYIDLEMSVKLNLPFLYWNVIDDNCIESSIWKWSVVYVHFKAKSAAGLQSTFMDYPPIFVSIHLKSWVSFIRFPSIMNLVVQNQNLKGVEKGHFSDILIQPWKLEIMWLKFVDIIIISFLLGLSFIGHKLVSAFSCAHLKKQRKSFWVLKTGNWCNSIGRQFMLSITWILEPLLLCKHTTKI